MKKLTLALLFMAAWAIAGIIMIPASTKTSERAALRAAAARTNPDQKCNQEGMFARIECLKLTTEAQRQRHCRIMKKLGARSKYCQ